MCALRALQEHKMVVWTEWDTRTNSFSTNENKKKSNERAVRFGCRTDLLLLHLEHIKVVVSKHEHLVLMWKLILMHFFCTQHTLGNIYAFWGLSNVCRCYNNRRSSRRESESKRNVPISILVCAIHDSALTTRMLMINLIGCSASFCARCASYR